MIGLAAGADIPARVIGKVGGDALKLPGEAPLMLETLRRAHESWLPAYMDGTEGE